MQELMDRICQKYGLTVRNQLQFGRNNDFVCLAVDRQDREVVVKAAKTSNAVAEIRMNEIGYQKLRACGLGFFIPKIIVYEFGATYAFMIMEYLGQNFLQQAQHTRRPLVLYQALLRNMKKVYRTSLRVGPEGGCMLESFVQRTVDVYEQYVYPAVDQQRQMAAALGDIMSSLDVSGISYYCFSNWDFTLEDTYLTCSGVKYSDPHDDIVGIPIIDLACFGGLVKLRGLPDCDKGYEEFKRFATGWVADLLHIPAGQAEKIFHLGRFFQCCMSIRFRHAQRPDQAQEIFAEAQEIIERIVA